MSLRRTLAVGLAALVSATLVGCIQLPVGPAQPTPTTPETSAPTTSAAPTSSAPSSQPATSEPTTPDGGLGPFTVDDGAGDTWTYSVAGYELPAQLESGTVPDGMVAVALLLDATHDEGSASWGVCFEVTFTGAQGGTYSVADDASQAVVAVNDIYLSVAESFTEGRAVIVVPSAEAAPGGAFTVTSVYGGSSETFPIQ